MEVFWPVRLRSWLSWAFDGQNEPGKTDKITIKTRKIVTDLPERPVNKLNETARTRKEMVRVICEDRLREREGYCK